AASAPFGVLPVDKSMFGTSVHDEQRKAMGGRVEGNLVDRAVLTVEQQPVAYLAAQGRRLVQATSRGPGDSVLRFDADAGQSRPGRVIAQQAQVKQVGCGCGNGTLEGRRAGEPRALGY